MIYLHKILPFFLSPLGVSLILLILFFFYRKKVFVLLSLLILLISSNSFVGNFLFTYLEHPHKPISFDTIKKADAIIVLSSGITQIKRNGVKRYQWGAPNRFFAGVNLLKNEKADLLVFTAGQLPWDNNWKPEGYVLKEKALELGVSQKKILVTDIVKNTYDESIKVAEMINNNSSIILVTSAFHMTRSKNLFEKQGFIVTTFPVDFKQSNSRLTILDFIPSIGALNKTSTFIREILGRLYYKIIF